MHFNEVESWELPWKSRQCGPFPLHIFENRVDMHENGLPQRRWAFKFDARIYPECAAVATPTAELNAYLWNLIYI